MVTLEQYLSIAYVYQRDNPDFNFDVNEPDGDYEETQSNFRLSVKTKQTRLMESQGIISNKIKSYVGVTPQKQMSRYRQMAQPAPSFYDQKSVISRKIPSIDNKIKVKLEIDKTRELIRKFCGENRVVEFENLLRDQKR